MLTQDFLWSIVLERKTKLEEVFNLPPDTEQLGIAKMLAESQFNVALQHWLKFVTR